MIRRPHVIALVLLATLANALVPLAQAGAPIPPPPAVEARGYILMDVNSGRILASQNADERLEPASLTKLMTAYVVFQSLRAGKLKLTDTLPISEHAWKAEGSRTFVEVGKRVKVEDLIRGMIVQSGNDATIALAEGVAGTEATFALLMNQYSARLGMKSSHWEDAPGLPSPQHYTTAHDLALLSAALIREFPDYYRWYSEREFTYNGITQQNRNGLLTRDPTVDGIKTGHTESAGYCLASSALRNGMRLVSIVLGTKSARAREDASAALLNYGFNFYETRRVQAAGQPVGQAQVFKVGDPVPVVLRQDLYATLPRGEHGSVKTALTLNDPLVAPIAATQPVGKLQLLLDGKAIAERPVFAAKAVEPGNIFRRALDSVKLWFH